MTPADHNSALIRSILDGWPHDVMDVVDKLVRWPSDRQTQDNFVGQLISLAQKSKENDGWLTAATALDMLKTLCDAYGHRIMDEGAPAAILPNSLACWALMVAAGRIDDLPKIGRPSNVLRDLKLLWVVDRVRSDLSITQEKAEAIVADATGLTPGGVRRSRQRGAVAKDGPLGEVVLDMLRYKHGGTVSFSP